MTTKRILATLVTAGIATLMKGEKIMRTRRLIMSLLLTALLGATANAQIRVRIPEDDPGPPFYAVIERSSLNFPPVFVPHTDEWAAIVFERQPGCVPDGFNLLDFFDVPAAFGCPLTVQGHAIFKNAPPPVDQAPIQVNLHGLGAVPIWFVSWPELQVALADDVLTVPELLSLPSLQIGSASFFKETQHPGAERPQGPGNGKIEITAYGTLTDGRTFQFQVREMGVEGVSVLRHITIEFR
jgi:hypothetical protein